MRRFCFLSALFLAIPFVLSHIAVAEEGIAVSDPAGRWRAIVDPDKGFLRSLEFRKGDEWDRVQFRGDALAGPQWSGVELRRRDAANPDIVAFEGTREDIVYSLRYQSSGGYFSVVVGLENRGKAAFAPTQARLVLGIDTEMIRFPQWNEVLFPTLLRCERSHFWGYFMGPSGRILGIASPDAIASYKLEYNKSGHRIYTCDLDVLHAPPLPARHSASLTKLEPGERKTWTIFLDEVDSLDALKPRLAALAHAPMIEAERYTLAPGEKTSLTFWSAEPAKLSLRGPRHNSDSVEKELQVEAGADGRCYATVAPDDGEGVYTLTAAAVGRQSEAKIYVRRPWSWYLERARQEAIDKPQKASTHRESWVGCFSTILAQQYFPEPTLDAAAEKMFQEIFPLMYDVRAARPLAASDPGRSQNHSVMISLLAARYAVTGNTNELDFAARLADWLIQNRQADDGSYRARSKTGTHYTSVHYMAKNILELAAQEKKLAADSDLWRERYERHFDSARRAIDDLVNRGDRVETEGEQTFEDSMVANTASQLALFALLQTDPAQRAKYAAAAARMHDEHRCLTQLEIPDCRMRGGTLRFWESQYDVLMKPNMVDSPHGWTAREIPGTWYLYLLTGEECYLRETMDAIGACMQLVDLNSGTLRWAFIPDPYIAADIFEPDPAQPGRGRQVKRIIGEQYIPMISGWWKAPAGQAVRGYSTTIPGSCCDNDVHEVFKAMAEIALTTAYVLERTGGQIVTWNCTARQDSGRLIITPSEKVVSRVHFNLQAKRAVDVEFPGSQRATAEVDAMTWLGPGGIPELLLSGPTQSAATR